MKKITIQKEISLVIGSIYKDLNELSILLSKLNENINYLNEIICVISGVNTTQKRKEVSNLKEISNIKINIVCIDNIVLPGEARNIGIRKSKFNYICFIDSYPLPDKNWISNSIKILEEKNLRGIFGKTKFIATNEFEDIFISATYGNTPLTSIPGTLIEKNLLREIGYFIPNYRSGEDAEWINRSKYFYPRLIQSKVIPCKYIGLKGKNFFDLCKKWYQYYSTVNPRFYSQKILYFSFVITLILLFALSWNVKIADLDQNSLFYVPHLSKIVFSLIILVYLVYRMIILPIRKNVKVFRFKINKFIKFFVISIIIDLIKLIAFFKPKNKF